MTADLGEARFREEVGTEEDCVQSTNNGISVCLARGEVSFTIKGQEKEDVGRGR